MLCGHLSFQRIVGFLKKCFRIRKFLSYDPLFEKKSESKNCWSKLSLKPERTCDFHERTDKDSAVFWLVHGALVGAGSLQTQERFEVGTLKGCAKHTSVPIQEAR
jgi:hypothetical protein